MASVQKISPFVMLDVSVEEAAKFYVSFTQQETKGNLP